VSWFESPRCADAAGTVRPLLGRQPPEKASRELGIQGRLALAHPPHRLKDLLLGGVLEDITRRPSLQCLQQVIGVLVHRHHEDADLGMPLLDLARGRQPIHLRHAHVHQEHVRPQTRAHQQRLPAVGSLTYNLDVGLIEEHIFEPFAGEVVVVDHHESCRRASLPAT
jgi:hypothetical protein